MSRIPRVTTCAALSAASENVTPSIRVVAVVAALLAFVGIVPTSAENRVWQPPVQVSHVDTTTNGVQVALSRDGSPRLHVVVGSQAPVDVTRGIPDPPPLSCNKFSTLLDYLVVDRDEPDWGAAWEERLRYTWDNPDVGADMFSTDAHFAVDVDDVPHFIHEEHQLANHIGYKIAGPTGWAVGDPPDFSPNAPESPIGTSAFSGGVSPSLYINEYGEADSIHAIWRHKYVGGGPDSGYWHNKTPLTGDDWGDPTLLTGVFEDCTGPPGEGGVAPALAITSDGALHLVGRCRVAPPAKTKIIHVRATWDDVNELWMTTETVIDSMLTGSGSEAEGDVSTDISVTSASLLGTEYLHTSYNYDQTGSAREIRYRRYTVRELEEEEEQEDLWSAPIVVTASPGTISSNGKLFQEANGPLHLIYHEGQLRGLRFYYDAADSIAPCEEGTIDPSEAPDIWRNELRHVSATGDATELENWSLPQSLTADMRTAFTGPNFVAEDDTLWALFLSHDDDDEARGGSWQDGNWEIWSRKSYPIDAVVADGDSMLWSGLVNLDRDFEVQEGGTLTIAPGTVVRAESDTDVVNVGRISGKVELIVRGTLIVDGETDDRVTFEATEGNEGDWGGVLFDLSGGESGYGFCDSQINNADIKDATSGIAIRQTGAPSLDGLAFERIVDDKHIILDSSDVYVPYEGAWNLAAPTFVKAAIGVAPLLWTLS